MIFDKVVAIGLGGIWSYFWRIMCRTLTYTKGAPKHVVLVDGDQFHFTNLERQDMLAGDDAKMKVDVYRNRFKDFPLLSVEGIPEFVTRKNISKIVTPKSIILLLVDNHKTRKLISKFVRDNRNHLRDIVVITSANDEKRANAHIYLVLGGKEITHAMDKVHPEIDKPKDKNPGELSCEELARLPGGGQTANANLWAASLAHNYFWEIVSLGNRSLRRLIKHPILTKSEVFVDLNHILMDSVSRLVE